MFVLLDRCLKKEKFQSINWCASDKQLADCVMTSTSCTKKLVTVFNTECGIFYSMQIYFILKEISRCY